MITAIAIDDEPLALDILRSFCDDIEFIQLDKTFTKTLEAKKYLGEFPVDLIFLDINMPEMSGIDFYKGLGQDTMVIFTTAHAQYALDGFELSAVDFLLKPYSFERFTIAVTKANEFHNFLNNRQTAAERHLFVRSEYSLVKVPLADIQYIEGLADYLKIHLPGGKTILSRMTMKNVLSKLPEQDFFRVHRSFIVPLQRIEAVRNKTVFMAGNREIPIGASYEAAFMDAYGKA